MEFVPIVNLIGKRVKRIKRGSGKSAVQVLEGRDTSLQASHSLWRSPSQTPPEEATTPPDTPSTPLMSPSSQTSTSEPPSPTSHMSPPNFMAADSSSSSGGGGGNSVGNSVDSSVDSSGGGGSISSSSSSSHSFGADVVHLDELTKEQRAHIDAARTYYLSVGGVLDAYADIFLLRFFVQHKWDVKRAHAMMRTTAVWRRRVGADDIRRKLALHEAPGRGTPASGSASADGVEESTGNAPAAPAAEVADAPLAAAAAQPPSGSFLSLTHASALLSTAVILPRHGVDKKLNQINFIEVHTLTAPPPLPRDQRYRAPTWLLASAADLILCPRCRLLPILALALSVSSPLCFFAGALLRRGRLLLAALK